MNTHDHAELFFKPGISPTSINQFFESPSRFWKYSSYNPNKERKEPTPAMTFGRLVHCLVLSPDCYEKDFAVLPTKTKEDIDTADEMKAFITANVGPDQKIPSKSTKADLVNIIRQIAPTMQLWQDKVDTFNKTLGRRTAVTAEQFATATQMKDAMFANKAVRQLIGNGMSEEPFCWFPEGEGGLMKKCRMDYNRSGLVIEYKTAIDVRSEEFAKSIANNGYHRQVAMQIEASTLKYGERPRGGIIIAQDKEMFDDIGVYALSANDISIGERENAHAFAEIKRRMSSNDWRSHPEEIQGIEMPRWYKAKDIT